MGILANLEPKEVFSYFEEICSIPHPSYKEKQLSDYCVDFAQKHNLEVHQDALGNIIIVKEATEGYEDVEPLILQGHLDMVCEKEADCDIDFEKDGLRLKIEGDYITACGTTLGGDDGIAIAYALAVLASDTLQHPRIEAVFTVSEEVGMEGAEGIDLSALKGHRLLNLDSEEEGYLLTSCAGGCRAVISLSLEQETKHGVLYEITVDGLKGGHSGAEIDKGRGNSNLLMGRVLMALEGAAEYSIVQMAGGLKDNAIPRETKASVLVETKDAAAFEEAVKKAGEAIGRELSLTDEGVRVRAVSCGVQDKKALTKESGRKVLLLLNMLPNGIQSMSAAISGLVETSLNLGILSLHETQLDMRYSVRSSVQTAKDFLVDKLRLLTEGLGGTLSVEGNYPAWEYRKDSPLREVMVRVYKEMYGKEPVIQAIHAGLECGLLAGKIKDLDAVSVGPDMVSIHTTEEKLSISSTKRVWEYLIEVMKQKA